MSPSGRQVDASVVGPVVCHFAEFSGLVGVVVPAPVAGELLDGVAEVLDVDGVAAGPSIPLLEGVDPSSQDRDPVEGVAEPNPGVVAIERGVCLVGACPRLVVPVDVRAGAVPGVLEVFDGALSADFGVGELVAGGPSPAPAGRVEAAVCVGVLPPGLIGVSCGGGELPTSRRRSLPRYGRGRRRAAAAEAANRARSTSLSVAVCSAILRVAT